MITTLAESFFLNTTNAMPGVPGNGAHDDAGISLEGIAGGHHFTKTWIDPFVHTID